MLHNCLLPLLQFKTPKIYFRCYTTKNFITWKYINHIHFYLNYISSSCTLTPPLYYFMWHLVLFWLKNLQFVCCNITKKLLQVWAIKICFLTDCRADAVIKGKLCYANVRVFCSLKGLQMSHNMTVYVCFILGKKS